METDRAQRARIRDTLFSILVLGSLWGLFEVVLGGAMRAAGMPYASAILVGLGLGTMGVGLALVRRPAPLLAVPAVAVLCKQLVVPILHVSVLCKANSCLAVLLEGAALVGVAALAGKRLGQGELSRMAVGAAAGLLGAGAFWLVGRHVAPCAYLLSFDSPAGLVRFLAVEGLLWAAFSGLLVPVGFRIGQWVRERLPRWQARPALYYAASALIVACAWLGSALAIAAGL